METALARMNVDDRLRALGRLIPETEFAPQTFLDLVNTQIMGADGQGKARPVEDLAYFLSVAKKANLDPLARQIHVVYRWDGKLKREKMSIQTGIDGLRLIAQRSNEYAGQDDIVYDSEEGKNPKWAKATVYRFNKAMGERVPFTATARWDEYVVKYTTQAGTKLSPLWEKMPYLMLGKVAEALALRKAFPQELSGLYTDDEMGDTKPAKPTGDLPTPDSVKKRQDQENGGQEVINEKPSAAPKEPEVVVPERKLKEGAIPSIVDGKEVYEESDYEPDVADKAVEAFKKQ